ncbi:type I glyceraldehyde-3-phosphate dehydrogenase [Candidatus Micrarchaeota archaeon]|nr:type I glyceraldehyde-3-phosphate dehydrogenase [Candidatus Micrarchaeota archaeon]
MRIGVSGFGRIGRMFVRAAFERGLVGKQLEIVQINNRSDQFINAHLFKYDSVMGPFQGDVKATDKSIIINGYEIPWTRETDPTKIPWKAHNVDVVIESTGIFKDATEASKHLEAGAKRVLISAPAKGCPSVVPGVNMEHADRNAKVFSLASCTTNCLGPVLKVLVDSFGVKRGYMTTIHAYTNDQNIVDGSHKDWRRARAAAVSIIPTTTGAAKAIGEVIPEMKGKMDGIALRVPVPDGSLVDLSVELNKEVTKEQVNAALKAAAQGPMKGILQYTEDPIVSCDIIGNPHSSIVDSQLTSATGNFVKVFSWYDNEWGYSNRLIDFVLHMKKW